MGKASRWFRGLLGLKKPDPNPDRPPPPTQPQPQSKKKWGFAKSSKKKSNHHRDSSNDASQRAVEVANATAAAAEAAVAAAHAAVEFVQLTSSSASGGRCLSQRRGGGRYGAREEHAAVMIQSHFRAYLSRRALRALKALVKLQALVRGHILRKQTAEILRGMQALVRVQARARAGRILLSEGAKSSHFNYTAPATPEKYEHMIKARSMKREQLMLLKRSNSKSSGNITFDQEKSHLSRHRTDSTRIGERSWEQASYSRSFPTDDERADKILEVDTGKPHGLPKYKTLFHSSHLSHTSDPYCQSFSTSSTARQPTVQSPSCDEAQSSSPFKKNAQDHESVFCTADNSPEFYSASSMGGSSKRAGPFTPTKSDGSRSCLSGYSDHPNYMAYTESSKAKVRSISAPKQRLQYERSSSANRYSVHGYGDSRYNNAHKVSTLHENFANKAYPGSGRLDRLGMPVRGDVSGFSGGHWHRY